MSITGSAAPLNGDQVLAPLARAFEQWDCGGPFPTGDDAVQIVRAADANGGAAALVMQRPRVALFVAELAADLILDPSPTHAQFVPRAAEWYVAVFSAGGRCADDGMYDWLAEECQALGGSLEDALAAGAPAAKQLLERVFAERRSRAQNKAATSASAVSARGAATTAAAPAPVGDDGEGRAPKRARRVVA
jgi:hypothetical protein